MLDESQFVEELLAAQSEEVKIEEPQPPVSAEEDARAQALSQGMTLLLAARERVLTLSEMRLLAGMLP